MNKRIFLSLLLLSTTSLFARGSWRPPSALSEPSFEMAPLPSELFEEPMNVPRKNPLKVFYYGKGQLIPGGSPLVFPTVGISVRPQLSRFGTIELDASMFSFLIASTAQISVCPLLYINENIYLRAGAGGFSWMILNQYSGIHPVFPVSIGYQSSTMFFDGGVDIFYEGGIGGTIDDLSALPTLRFGTTF